MLQLARALSRWLWLVAVASELVAAFTASSASAQLPQDEYTFSYDLRGEPYDEATVHVAIEELMQQSGVTLGEKILQYSELYAAQTGAPVPPRPSGPTPDGRVTFEGGVLQVTLQRPPGDVQISAKWWVEWLAGFAGIAANIVFRTACVAGMVAVGGPLAALAAPTCAALAGALGAAVPPLILYAVDGKLGTRDGMVAIVGAILAAALGGAYWEIFGKQIAEEVLAPIFKRLGIWLGARVASWASWLGDRAVQAGNQLTDFFAGLSERLWDLLNNIIHAADGGPSGDTRKANLRVMPLGDSITAGLGSSTGSSYRADLWNALGSHTRDFVGSQRAGQLPDVDHEGHSGWLIHEIAGLATNAVSAQQPNVVTLLIGTNDMARNNDVGSASERLGNLIDQVLAASSGSVVLVANLPPSLDPGIQARIDQFNPQIPTLVSRRQQEGKKVLLVDVSAVSSADLADELHPNDNGYRKIASAFFGGIQRAVAARWVSTPNPIAADFPAGPAACENPGGWHALGQIATGVNEPGDKVRFGDFNGDRRDDYLILHDNGAVDAWLNTGTTQWRPIGQIATGVGEPGYKIHFADYNGDGRDDYLVLQDNGAVDAWINTGTIVWQSIGNIATGVGEPASKVRFADYNGDQRVDYLIVEPGGAVRAWLNTGGPVWNDIGEVATGVGEPGTTVRLTDINCDSFVDYVVLTPSGSMYGWLNTGTPQWTPTGLFAAGVGVPDNMVRFADFDGDGRDDYFVLSGNGAVHAWLNKGGGDNSAAGWVVRGQVATGVNQPGYKTRFADYNGDGRDDYYVLHDNGSVDAWLNGGGELPQGNGWNWTALNQIALGVGEPGYKVRFADYNGDYRDDYVVLQDNGAVDVWINNGTPVWRAEGRVAAGVGEPGSKVRFADYNGDLQFDYWVLHDNGAVDVWVNYGTPEWYALGQVATGVGEPARKIRFADVNGDARDDYLVVHDDSSVDAWLNTGTPQWAPYGRVATGVGVEGSRVVFGDLSGDLRKDYLVVHDNGAVNAWLTQGAWGLSLDN